MKKNVFAALLGSVLFMAGFALATGVDENMAQAVAVLILMGGALACFRYADKSIGEAAEVKSEGVKREKSIGKANCAA